jgi:biotin carboxyl carrier protein
MKIKAETGGEEFEVEISRSGDKLSARVGERVYDLDVSEPEKNVFLFKNGGKISEALVSYPLSPGDPYSVRVGASEFDIQLTDPKRLRGSAVDSQAMGGKAEIKTAMPGKVVRILVADGDEVTKGDGLIVVEAMKMQNEMRSPKDGHISGIRVAEGDTVGAGDVLLIVE